MRGIFGLASLTATFAVVAALLVTLPSHPSGPAATGSVYSIDWHNATKPPFTKLDFGPYFTTLDNQLLMVATTGSTTTVWATTDGSTWTQRSGSGAFGIDGRRFVAQGFSDDGQGGLVVIGNSLGSSATDVEATAWRARPLTIRPRPDFFCMYAPYFAENVRRDVARRYGVHSAMPAIAARRPVAVAARLR